jgi:hypothetical protein
MTSPADIIRDPVLHWRAIAEHARRYHGATFASDDKACDEITGAFDSILPRGCDYNHHDGTIIPAEHRPDTPLPTWGDTQLLACMIAALATSPPQCALEVIYDTQTIVGPPPPGA